MGDDTTAIDSVLKADVWRDTLLKEEFALTTRLNELEKQGDEKKIEDERGDLAAQLVEVHAHLVEMEAETAPARAASLLAGKRVSRSLVLRYFTFGRSRIL